MLKEKYQKEIDEIISRYPVKRSALIPLLYLAQQDEGFVSEAAMKEIAGLLRLTPPQVYETATFYTMINLKPVGKFHLQVCKSLMCALAGSDTVIGWVKTKLGIGPGETTATTGELPRTGGSSAPLAIGALLVLLAGAALVSGSRRRRR